MKKVKSSKRPARHDRSGFSLFFQNFEVYQAYIMHVRVWDNQIKSKSRVGIRKIWGKNDRGAIIHEAVPFRGSLLKWLLSKLIVLGIIFRLFFPSNFCPHWLDEKICPRLVVSMAPGPLSNLKKVDELVGLLSQDVLQDKPLFLFTVNTNTATSNLLQSRIISNYKRHKNIKSASINT